MKDHLLNPTSSSSQVNQIHESLLLQALQRPSLSSLTKISEIVRYAPTIDDETHLIKNMIEPRFIYHQVDNLIKSLSPNTATEETKKTTLNNTLRYIKEYSAMILKRITIETENNKPEILLSYAASNELTDDEVRKNIRHLSNKNNHFDHVLKVFYYPNFDKIIKDNENKTNNKFERFKKMINDHELVHAHRTRIKGTTTEELNQMILNEPDIIFKRDLLGRTALHYHLTSSTPTPSHINFDPTPFIVQDIDGLTPLQLAEAKARRKIELNYTRKKNNLNLSSDFFWRFMNTSSESKIRENFTPKIIQYWAENLKSNDIKVTNKVRMASKLTGILTQVRSAAGPSITTIPADAWRDIPLRARLLNEKSISFAPQSMPDVSWFQALDGHPVGNIAAQPTESRSALTDKSYNSYPKFTELSLFPERAEGMGATKEAPQQNALHPQPMQEKTSLTELTLFPASSEYEERLPSSAAPLSRTPEETNIAPRLSFAERLQQQENQARREEIAAGKRPSGSESFGWRNMENKRSRGSQGRS